MADSTLFIPDISGFTRFVNSTEISHGAHIIEELINLIVERGSETFEMAEVEGDAVFFYLKDEKLSLDEVEKEAREIYADFHKHLAIYEHGRLCDCGACTQAINLKLKFIVHSGEIELANYAKGAAKPFGSPVIAVHRLLKNEVPLDEYLLFTKEFAGEGDFVDEDSSNLHDSDLGEITYNHRGVELWQQDLLTLPGEFESSKTDIQVEFSTTMNHSLSVLHRFISDFRYRHLWNKSADEIIYDENEPNQVGTEHLCVIKGKNLSFATTKQQVNENQRSYGEILKNPSPLKYLESQFILTELNENETNMVLSIGASVKWFQKPLVGIIRKKVASQAEYIAHEISEALEANESKVLEQLSQSVNTEE
jgi:hypothetical protein